VAHSNDGKAGLEEWETGDDRKALPLHLRPRNRRVCPTARRSRSVFIVSAWYRIYRSLFRL